MEQRDLENRFTYHPPKPGQPDVYKEIRGRGMFVAEYVNKHCPDSREKSLAFTKLEEAIMWANASIARNT